MLAPAMAKPAIDDLQEWQECRQTIARFDGILAEIRKYGFTLVTILLTANALVTSANPVVDRVAASIVVMALLLTLFLLDNYYWALLRATVGRADEIEATGTHISGVVGTVARKAHASGLVLALYGLFVVIAGGIALVTVVTANPVAIWGVVVVIGFVVIELASMAGIHVMVERESRLSTRVLGMAARLMPSRRP